jgi:predicted  nucleic acid-binding Zn-ribbon protein
MAINHKCVKCGKTYEELSEEILRGCICGSKLFYFVKQSSKGKKKQPKAEEAIEYFYELEDAPSNTVFDIEAIKVISSGKYEVNLDGLMNNNGIIYEYGEGKYSVDLDNNLRQLKNRNSKR